jgi:hypothetical protein
MSTEITANTKTFFKLQEGSNYRIQLTYDRIEVVEFAQFKRLMSMINDADISFVSINDRIVNKSTIIDISPTKELTKSQQEAADKKKMDEFKAKMHVEFLETEYRRFAVSFYNDKFGQNAWSHRFFTEQTIIANAPEPHKTTITKTDMDECWTAFTAKYPKEAAELKASHDLT